MDLACLCNAKVGLLAVIDPSKELFAAEATSIALESEEQSVSSILQGGLGQLKKRRLKAQAEIRFGSPATEISKFACEFGADLIVVGHREQRPWMRWWNGSVGASVLVHAPCSLLVAVEASPARPVPLGPCEVESFEKHARKRRSSLKRVPSLGGGDAA